MQGTHCRLSLHNTISCGNHLSLRRESGKNSFLAPRSAPHLKPQILLRRHRMELPAWLTAGRKLYCIGRCMSSGLLVGNSSRRWRPFPFSSSMHGHRELACLPRRAYGLECRILVEIHNAYDASVLCCGSCFASYSLATCTSQDMSAASSHLWLTIARCVLTTTMYMH